MWFIPRSFQGGSLKSISFQKRSGGLALLFNGGPGETFCYKIENHELQFLADIKSFSRANDIPYQDLPKSKSAARTHIGKVSSHSWDGWKSREESQKKVRTLIFWSLREERKSGHSFLGRWEKRKTGLPLFGRRKCPKNKMCVNEHGNLSITGVYAACVLNVNYRFLERVRRDVLIGWHISLLTLTLK